MRALTFLVAGRLDNSSGGSIYNRRIAQALAAQGWSVRVEELDDSFPFPSGEALVHAAEVMAHIATHSIVLVDGLAFGAMPAVVGHEADRLAMVPIVHLPLAAAVGLERVTAERLAESERRALSHATRVIVTGDATRALMDQLALVHHNVTTIEPGTDRADIAIGSRSDTVRFLCVATLNPGKGHRTLIEALAALPHRQWTLTCAGNLTRHPETTAAVQAAIRHHDLADNVSLAGELSAVALDAEYRHTDVAVLASLRETYCMAVAEALARGIPVVATATGAIPTLVGHEAGVVVPPGDVGALANALQLMTDDAAFRHRAAEGAARVRDRLPTWSDAALRLSALLQMDITRERRVTL